MSVRGVETKYKLCHFLLPLMISKSIELRQYLQHAFPFMSIDILLQTMPPLLSLHEVLQFLHFKFPPPRFLRLLGDRVMAGIGRGGGGRNFREVGDIVSKESTFKGPPPYFQLISEDGILRDSVECLYQILWKVGDVFSLNGRDILILGNGNRFEI